MAVIFAIEIIFGILSTVCISGGIFEYSEIEGLGIGNLDKVSNLLRALILLILEFSDPVILLNVYQTLDLSQNFFLVFLSLYDESDDCCLFL